MSLQISDSDRGRYVADAPSPPRLSVFYYFLVRGSKVVGRGLRGAATKLYSRRDLMYDMYKYDVV
jgi:hypothetical protein